MKVQAMILGVLVSLVALAAGKPAEETGMAQLLLRSCDHNADNALNAAEFAGCLMQQRGAAGRLDISRSELLQGFMDEADQNNDLRADEAELQEWSSRWFLSGLFGGGGSITIDFNQIVSKIVIILQYISEENYSEAVSELYVLVSGSELSSTAKASITLAITAIENGEYGRAVGFVYAVIKEIAGGDDAGGIFIVSSSTITNVASLLQAVIENDSSNINYYIYRSLAGVIVDFSFLSQESASSVAALIQAVIENNSAEIYVSLQAVISTIEGISTETATALSELLEVVVDGSSSEISVKILAVFTAVLEDDDAAEIAEIFVAVIQAVLEGDSEEAIKQLTLLYVKITGSETDSGFSTATVVAFAAIITALEDDDSDGAVAAVRLLISRSSSEFTSSQISSLEIIISTIEDGDYEDAITLLIAIATSGGSSGSRSSVEITVEVFVALSSVITVLEDSSDSDAAIVIIEEILSDSSVTISVEVREALQILVVTLSEESARESLKVVAAIITGSSSAFSRTISVQVVSEVELIIAALDDDDFDGAIAIVEALIEGNYGLSIVVKNDFKSILIALESEERSRAFALLTIISAGERSSSSFSVSTTVSLLVAIEVISSGSDDDAAIAELELLLEDDYIESSFKSEIRIFISYVKEKKRSKAMTAIIASMIGSRISITKSAAAILYASLRYAAAGDSEDAIEEIEQFLEDYSDSELRFALLYVIQLLRQENSQGALTIINTIIVETFGDDCYCD